MEFSLVTIASDIGNDTSAAFGGGNIGNHTRFDYEFR